MFELVPARRHSAPLVFGSLSRSAGFCIVGVCARAAGNAYDFEVNHHTGSLEDCCWRTSTALACPSSGLSATVGSSRADLNYRKPAYLICYNPHLPPQEILQAYLWRWEIEVNVRGETICLVSASRGSAPNRLSGLQPLSSSLLTPFYRSPCTIATGPNLPLRPPALARSQTQTPFPTRLYIPDHVGASRRPLVCQPRHH